MSQYTTGEIAKLCDVSVRTVQFYDSKDLLKPTELTEGGRRLYSDVDLKKLRLICLLKSLDLSLNSIKAILENDSPEKILLPLLDEQEKEIDNEISIKQKQLGAIQIVRESIQNSNTIPVQTIGDIERIMSGKKQLRKVYGMIFSVGILMNIIQWGTLFLWIFKGIWLPFAIGMPIVILLGVMLFRMYYRNTAYICADCKAIFQPSAWEMFWSKHTPKTRKLKCPECNHKGFCIEIANEKQFIN